MVLTRGDDFPIHQTPEPVAHAGTDRNFYDRYFFNGYAPDGSLFFAVAFGVYPHLDVSDAHLAVSIGGLQHNLHASAENSMERMTLKCGPVGIEVLEPLQKIRIRVDEQDGMSADLTMTGRAFPIEEPRFTHRIGSRLFMDYTRLTQNCTWEGWIEIDGKRHELGSNVVGTRDRSWGIRPVGAPDAQPNPAAKAPAFFWQWTPINLHGGSLFYHLNAEPDGHAWNTRAAWVPHGGGAEDIVEGEGRLETGMQQGTRWPAKSVLHLDLAKGPSEVTLDPVMRFQMRGLGYTHPKWNHGLHHGPLEVEREDIDLAALDPLAPENLHVQILCNATCDKGKQGMGIFEQLAIGPYEPFGLIGMFDGAG
ncbi:hypothetical protein [Altererythrobacter sp. MF3-039]|uniref:hypothetical protein n=1 Tax=Altererythrobacter sp. MF3-039 TaxID=3252901 RepID=UPI00390C652B